MRLSFFVCWWLVLSGGLSLSACAQRPKPTAMPAYQTDKFHLSAGPCAAKGYPMTIHFGAFVRSDGKTFPVPSGHELTGLWGRSSIGWVVGDEQQPAPDSLEILYFSYLEDQFYKGHFALPQQRIHDLLQAGFWDKLNDKATTYNELVVCVLPAGAVFVWLTGGGRQTLIGRYQASAAPQLDFRRFYPSPETNRAQMLRDERAAAPPVVQAQLRAGPLTARQWDEYLPTYPWRVSFTQSLVLTNYKINFVNAEYTNYPDTRDILPYLEDFVSLTPRARPVPEKLWLYVKDEAGHRHLLRVDPFAEAETRAAFRTLYQASPAAALELIVETDKYVKQARLWLSDGTRTLPLSQSKVQVKALD